MKEDYMGQRRSNMGTTIPTRKAQRRKQEIEDTLVKDILSDEEFDAAYTDAAKPKVKKEMEIPETLPVDWDRTHNHRVPLGKKVFGSITYGDVERAIWKSEGMLTNVARELRISVYYLKTVLSKYKLLRQDFEEFREALLDEAEMCLRAKIKRGDTSAMIFFLKCVGKQRGYVEYEKSVQKKGSVKMKIVPATDPALKAEKKAATKAAKSNVVKFKKVDAQ